MDTPTAELAASVVERALGWRPATVRRFSNGSAHYVYEAIPHDGVPVVVRIGRPSTVADRQRLQPSFDRLIVQL